jgi:hypothetical protein
MSPRLYRWVPGWDAISTDAFAVERGSGWRDFLCGGDPIADLLATWFSSARMANLERQTAKLQRNRARIQKQRRDRDRYDAR